MTVIVIFSLLLFGFLPYQLTECATICQQNYTCVPISECIIGTDEGDVIYPCKYNKYVCCPKLKNNEVHKSQKYEPFNIIKPSILENENAEIVERVNNTNVNRISEYNKEESDFNFYYENETPPPFISNHNKETNFNSIHNQNKRPNSTTNIEDANEKNNKINDQKINKKPQTASTTEKNSDGIRFNIPDYGNTSLPTNNKTPEKLSNPSSYKVQNNSNPIVTRKEPFKKNCGLTTADNKITGGQVAEPGQFPWMALLGFKHEGIDSVQFLCGGSLITDRHILTAAHCIVENKPLELVLVRLGEYNLTSTRDCMYFHNEELCMDPHIDVQVNRIIVHPGYSQKTLKNDIAIVWLKRKVRESDYIRTVCLPFDRDFSQINMTGQNFTVSGWGKSNSGNLFGSDILQYAKVSTWDQEKCDNSIPPEVKPLSLSQLCANGPNTQDACKGDSGGPLVNTTLDADSEIRHIQLGIVSFGTSTCGDRNLPTIYTRVDRYLNWIVENVT